MRPCVRVCVYMRARERERPVCLYLLQCVSVSFFCVCSSLLEGGVGVEGR